MESFCPSVRPQIERGPNDLTVVVGSTVSLECVARGQPRPVVTWKKNDLPLPSNSRYSTPSNHQLIITNAHYDDRGLFRCVASNQEGTTSAFARVEVLCMQMCSIVIVLWVVISGYPRLIIRCM